MVLLFFPGLPSARAGTFLFSVQSEQVVTGTSTGIGEAQADDGIAEILQEVDTAPDVTTAPSTETITTGTKVSGSFAGDVSTEDGVYIRYQEADTTSGNSTAAIGYRSSTGTNLLNSTKQRTWSSAAWGAESELNTAGSEIAGVRVAYNPGVRPNEYVVVTQSTDQFLDAYVWDGSTWQVTNNIAQADFVSGKRSRSFDIAYETLSGRAVLVYGVVSVDTTKDLAYRIWDGTSWAAEAYIDDTGHTTDINYAHVSLATKPDSDTIGMIGVDRTDNDVNVWVWDGTSWGNNLELATTLQNPERDRQPADVAWEMSSLALMAVTGDTEVLKYARFTGSWSTISTLDFNGAGNGKIVFVTLKSDPVRTSNYLMLTIQNDNTGANEGLFTLLWDGSSWTSTSQDTAPDAGNTGRPADFAWEPSGSKGLLVWGTTNGQITYRTFTAPSTWGAQTDAAMGANAHIWVQVRTNPRDVTGDIKILGAVLEGTAFDLGAIKWDGSTFTVIGAFTFTADTASVVYEAFDIEFKPSRSQLSVRYDFSSVPSGDAYELVVTGYRAGENIAVQVLTAPSTWNSRITVASGTSQRYAYTLTGQEYNGSNPSVRFVDVSGSDGVASDVYLDWVAVRTVNLQYVLEVYHNVTGISVSGISFLAVKGNVTVGGENFNVHVWNFTAAAWDLALAAPFTATNAYHNVSLAPDHVSGGTVRVRFVDAGAGGTVQGALSLDFVAVAVVNGPAALTNDAVSPSSGNLATTFTFSVRYADAENEPPAFVELVLNGTPYAMAETNPADTTYTDGKDYETNVMIGARGTFDYLFRTQAASGDVAIAASSVLQVSVENRVPTITNPLSLDGVHTGDSYVRTFTGSDPDGDSLTWSLATDAAWLSIGPTNGTVWGQAPAAPVDVYANVTASDGHGGTAWNNYTLSVGNLAPGITNPVMMDTVHTGRSYLRDFDATDPEGDALAWSLASNAPWLSAGPANGTVWGLAPPVASVFYVNVTVDDGFDGSAFTNYTLSVGNLAPTIANAIPTASAFRRASFVHDFDATDVDGDILAWSLRTNASFLAVGALNGTVFGVTGATPGSYWVEVTASDGFGGADLANFTLLVVNRGPQVTVDAPPTGEAGALYTAAVSAVDPDGDAVTWTLATNASWLFFDPTGPTVTGTAAPGTYYALVTARDPYGDAASSNFTIIVASAPPPPTSGNLLPGVLSYLALGVGAFAVALFVVRRSRRREIEQAFLLDGNGTVRFAFSPPGAPLDEARLRALLARVAWRSAESIPADPPYMLHVVPQGVSTWLFVSRHKDGARVRRAAGTIMARAETSWATAPDRNT